MKHNEDLENKLLKVQEEARRIGTASTLKKDKLELPKINERHNHEVSITDMKLLAATGVFPKKLSKCARLGCST